jgi:formylglycine-generating enzyme required for sulfatase activity
MYFAHLAKTRTNEMNESIKVFISYAHKDDELRQELIPHLSSAQKEGLIELWHDREIRAGADWANEIDEKLEQADIILFLVSADFINSRYCSGIEMARAIERHQAKTACAIPIIIRFSDWTSTRLGELQAVPRDNKPVTSWGNDLNNPIERDEPWLLVVKEISQVAKEIRDKRKAELTVSQKAVAQQSFRVKAEEYYQEGIFSPTETALLNLSRQNLGLGEQESEAILQEVKAAYQQSQSNLEEYRRVLIAEWAGQESLRTDQRAILQDLQTALGISDSEAEQVGQRVLAERDLERQKIEANANNQVEEQPAVNLEQNLQRFREELQRAVTAEYPLNNHVESGIRSFQLSLNLTDAEVAHIKADVLAYPEAVYREQVWQRAELERKRQAELDQLRQDSIKQQEQSGANQISNSQNETYIQLQSFSFDVITVDKKGNENSRTRKTAELFVEDLGNKVLLEMVKVPKGTYHMGSPTGQGKNTEWPKHTVTLPDFLMGKYLVTQKQWQVVAALPQEEIALNPAPSNFKGDNLPVECVNWIEAVEFCQRLSRKTGRVYRLPSEAEWEYACQAGTTTEFHFGETLTPELARVKANSGMALFTIFAGETSPVGSFLPNSFGLFDLHGNVYEWCSDCWHDNYNGAPADGKAWLDFVIKTKVVRGGCCKVPPSDCRTTSRMGFGYWCASGVIGFRLVCEIFPGLL